MTACTYNLRERGEGVQRCGDPAAIGNRCRNHRNGIPSWAQHAIDSTFGPDARIGTSRPGDGHTRYYIEDATGSRTLTRYYLGRGAFLDALSMLHSALEHRRQKQLEATR